MDFQSVKTAARVSEAVGYDAAKHILGRKRHLTVDTLGLVLRVFVRAASVGEREGAKRVLNRVKRMGKAVSRLHTIWVDGGYDGRPFMVWVMDVCRWIVQVVWRPAQTKGFSLLKKRWFVERTFGWLLQSRRLVRDARVTARNIRDVDLPCHDSFDGAAFGIKTHTSYLFKRPLRKVLVVILRAITLDAKVAKSRINCLILG